MKELKRRFHRFCVKNQNKGIPNLMLYITLGAAALALMNMIDPSHALYSLLSFDRDAILHGQIWRLITYPLCYASRLDILSVLMMICYYSMGQGIENVWGTLRFNLFYLTGIVLMDVYCMIFGCFASVSYLNLSLFLAYATLYPNAQFMIFFIIPVKAWILAVFDLALVLIGLFDPFPYNLFGLISLGNYFLFFGKGWVNVFPMSWRINARRLGRKTRHPRSKTIPFNAAGSYQATHAKVKADYTHKCTVCGRTDVDSPELEFRYCSRCRGYHCYCQEHISNHAHITE
ncbi:MAG: rhomboid family intramembrane serine protease [Oscillospiraceae bacterium]|nr:rhomboid family intramembrane serine protease [Oscillospiraceae bacterium]